MTAARFFLAALSFFLPWRLRRILLVKVFRYDLAPSARIGWSWVFPESLVMEEDSRILHLTICRNLQLLRLGPHSAIGNFNWITGGTRGHYFQTERDRRSQLVLDQYATITGRHYLDCTNAIEVGAFSVIAGIRSVFMSHGIDVADSMQRSAPIRVGKYCLVSTCCVLLPGASVPDYSVVAAMSLVDDGLTETYRLYAGAPARSKKGLPADAAFFDPVARGAVADGDLGL